MLPKQAQDEVWGQSPDNLIGSALVFPRGRARRVEGGYRVSGRWPFSSGVDPSSWNLIGAIAQDEEAGTASRASSCCRRATTRSSTPGT